MSRPAFQFYPKDWRNNAKLRRCSEAARGAWMDVLCLLHDSDEYGVLRWPLADIARAAGVPLRLVKELATKGVFKGADKAAADYVWAPTHAGKKGEPVTLVTAGDGPCWYCSRFVKDEEIRRRRGQDSRFGAESGEGKGEQKGAPNTPPNPPIGGGSGDGPSSASASASALPPVGGSTGEGEDPARTTSPADLPPQQVLAPSEVTNEQAALAVQLSIALRRIGLRCQPQDPHLLAIASAGFTVKEAALLAAEKVLRDALLWNDPDVHPELHERLASGATQQQMGLTPQQLTDVRYAAAELGTKYIATALHGRRRDAQRLAAENAAGAQPGKQKPRANDNFEGKAYVGTPVDQLPPELRDAVNADR